MKWHPDRHYGKASYDEASQRSIRINLAYEILKTYISKGSADKNQTWRNREGGYRRRDPEAESKSDGFSDPSIFEVFIDSTAFVSTGYDSGQKILYIKFRNGSVYRHFNVPSTVFDEFVHAKSHGRFWHEVINGRYRQEPC